MNSANPPNHRAIVDADGNIILPGVSTESVHTNPVVPLKRKEAEAEMQEGLWYSAELEKSLELPWTDTTEEEDDQAVCFPLLSFEEAQNVSASEEEQKPIVFDDPIAAMLAEDHFEDDEIPLDTAEPKPEAKEVWQNVRGKMYALTTDALQESARQYQSSFQQSMVTSRSVLQAFAEGTVHVWHFLTQPVWVPGRHNQPKQYSRGTLFILDSVRFGGTFASLFVVLFVSLNFQSFWSIAHSYVEPLADLTAGTALSSTLDKGLADKLKKIPSLAVAGADNGNLVSYLPEVGPPDDRLIIPKLDLNVPIVIPSNVHLLKEDWPALEEDIQQGLQDGVVHYPGTARPGQAGNFFVTGHSSYFPWAPGKYKSVFARLANLNVGDEYWVYYGGDKYRYVISEKKEINPGDVSVLDQPVGKRISSLMTCTPVGTTLRRLIITAQEVDPLTGTPMEVGEHQQESMPKTRVNMLSI